MTGPAVAKVLRQAEQVIGERGWCQEEFEVEGHVCVRGAINLVVRGTPSDEVDESDDPHDLGVRAALALAAFLGLGYVADVSEWNDEDGRTEDEVRAVLLGAAEKASES